MFLLDTNVVSEAIKPAPNARVLSWLESHAGTDGYLSVLTLGEIEQGIVRSPSPKRAAALAVWLEDDLLPLFERRILPLDKRVMQTWGRITGSALNEGRPTSYPDSLLAATAITHNLVLVTRNTKDVKVLPVQVLNPWE